VELERASRDRATAAFYAKSRRIYVFKI